MKTQGLLKSVLAVVTVGFASVLMLSKNGSAQTVSSVYAFTSQTSSQNPEGVVPAQGRDGKLYGTTNGGTNGSIFRVTTAGAFAELLAFDLTDGSSPYGGVSLASDGNYYGTTGGGGSGQNGVLFRISANGTYTELHDFAGGADGNNPVAPPIQAADGNLYGTTEGVNTGSTVYKYSRISGSFTTIYQFDGTNGQSVFAPLIQGTDGNLYGTALAGGTKGCGAIFRISTSGVVLKSFSFPCRNGGATPAAPLLQASDGNFYGTTELGGTNGFGTIFKMTPKFQVSILYSFKGGSTDGSFPTSGLVQATDGNFYGTTETGGTANSGTLFQVSPTGTYKSVYSFTGETGEFPFAGLLQQTNGTLYGTANQGGKNGFGSVFSLDMGLGPFITFVVSFGKVGQTAQILGQGLTGASGVTFNGIPATGFSVLRDTYMTAVVPSGATTGPVVVTTPTGTLSSNKNFVIPGTAGTRAKTTRATRSVRSVPKTN